MNASRKNLNKLLNAAVLIASSIYPCSLIYYYLDRKFRPENYAFDSAPWHTRTIPFFIFSIIALSVCVFLKSKYGKRNGFLIGLVDFFTAGIFLLIYMPSGLQDEIDQVLDRRTQRYWVAYLLGIPTLFIYTLVWTARIAEELKKKALELGIESKQTSFRHMFWWNILGVLILIGPMIATQRFFGTLDQIEIKMGYKQAD